MKRINSSPQQTVTVAYSQCRVTVFCSLLLAQLILISLYYTLSGLTRNNGLSLHPSPYTGDEGTCVEGEKQGFIIYSYLCL